MSLTREQWMEMWEETKKLEYYISDIPPHIGYKKFLRKYVRYMKKQIQSVIGQME